MKGMGAVVLATLVAFPTFTVAVYGPCCTTPGGCQSQIPGPRHPCCEQKGPCCTPRIFSVQNQIDAADSVAPFSVVTPVAEADLASVPASLGFEEPTTVHFDPSQVPRPPTPLFVLNCSLLR